jgi:hypothetical protein
MVWWRHREYLSINEISEAEAKTLITDFFSAKAKSGGKNFRHSIT